LFWSSAAKLIDFGEIQGTPSTVFPVLKKDLAVSGVIRATTWAARVWVRRVVPLNAAVLSNDMVRVNDMVLSSRRQP
jgi:hypothetical protein